MIVNTNRNVTYFALVAIFLFSITASWHRDITRICEGLFIITSLLCIRDLYRSDNNRSTSVLLMASGLLLAIMVYANYWASITYDPSINHERFLRFYIKLLLFIPVGWWLSRQQYSTYVLIGCIVLGIILTIVINGASEAANMLNFQSRLGLGFSNAQHSAMYGGSLLLILLCIVPIIFTIRSPAYKMLAAAGLSLLILFSLWMLILTKSRGVWLGLACVAPFGLFLLLSATRYGQRLQFWKTAMISFFVSLLILGAVSQLSFVKSRLTAELNTHTLILQGEFDKLPMSSTGIRFAQWSFALDLIKARPLLGYGGDTKTLLIAQSNMPAAAKNNFGHFHNSYLELAVAYGVFAASFFIAIIVLLMYRSAKCLRASESHRHPLVYLGIIWPPFFAIANIFESYVMYRTGYVLLAVVGGIIYGVTYRYNSRKATYS